MDTIRTQVKVGFFQIPEDLARELSELLTKQTIRERTLDRMLKQGDPDGYEQAENLLLPITAKVEALKQKITNEFVPEAFRCPQYMWNYDGYDIAGVRVDIFELR